MGEALGGKSLHTTRCIAQILLGVVFNVLSTGSGVYHPRLNISQYVSPRGVGITNTISHAELAAALNHGFSQPYSHIV
jgi:hypothetical protein